MTRALPLRRRLLPYLSLSPAYPSRFACIRHRPWLSGLLREMLAELLATFVQMMVGQMANAQMVIGQGNNGNWLTMALSWGLAVMLGVYVAGGVSGAHMNPAVTMALAVQRGFEWYKVPAYIFAQFVGAFLGTAMTLLVYADAVDAFDPVGPGEHYTDKSAGIFMTMAAPWLTVRGAIFDNMAGTATLLLSICALSDARNFNPVAANLHPLLLGLTVTTVALTMGMNGGAAINPVRDFPQRLFLSMAGWGSGVFGRHGWYWPVPLFCPIVGGQLGVMLYDICINLHHDRAVGAVKGSADANAAVAAAATQSSPAHAHTHDSASGDGVHLRAPSMDSHSYGSGGVGSSSHMDLQLQPSNTSSLCSVNSPHAPVIDIHAVGGLACAELSDPKGMVHVNQGFLDPSIKASADATFHRKGKAKAHGSMQEPLLNLRSNDSERDAPL